MMWKLFTDNYLLKKIFIMKKDLKNKVVVITGASAGLGRAMVRKFARHGAKIALIARGEDGLEAAQKEVEAMGSEALVVPLALVIVKASKMRLQSLRKSWDQ